MMYFLVYLSHLYFSDVHSFPTRRSSDLVWRQAAVSGCPAAHPCWCLKATDRVRWPVPAAGSPGQVVRPVPPPGAQRSEEHTSELQSRGHLVCRLLLEKKKNTI